MKKVFLFVLVLITMNATCYSQHMYEDYINFEGPHVSLTIDGSQPNNIWQIGQPGKLYFDASYSASNAIVTDALNAYPSDNVSSFILKEPLDFVNILSFRHKYDTDSLHAGGYIEVSVDSGATWNNIITDSSLYNSNGFNSLWSGFYNQADTITGGIPAFTGRSDGWQYAEFRWELYCLALRGGAFGEIWIRFTFKSDGLQTGKEGWMIDDIAYVTDFCSAVKSDERDAVELSPNPAADRLIVSTTGGDTKTVTIYNLLGGQVLAHTLYIMSGTYMLDVSGLSPGAYILTLAGESGNKMKRFVKQ